MEAALENIYSIQWWYLNNTEFQQANINNKPLL